MSQEELRMKKASVSINIDEDDLKLAEKVKSENLKSEDVRPEEEKTEKEDQKEPPSKKQQPLDKMGSTPPPGEEEKKNQKEDKSQQAEKAETKGPKPIPTKSWGHVFVTFINEYNKSTDLITSETNLRFLGIGGEYNKKTLAVIKHGYQLKGKIGLPIFKDEYKVPYSHVLRGHYFLSDLFKRFSIYAGGEHSTLYSVNIPIFGEGLQLVDSTILWGYVGFDCYFNDEKIKLSYDFSSSLGVSNKINRTFQATRHQYSVWSQLFGKVGLGLSGSMLEAAGDFAVSAQNYELLITYSL